MKRTGPGRLAAAWLAGAFLLTSACTKKEEKEVEAPAPVQVTAVTQDTIRRVVAGDGVLFPQDQYTAMPKIQAPVQKFYANRGDHVKPGQLLATLDNRDLKAAAEANKGQLAQAEANYRATTLAQVPESIVKANSDVESAKQQLDAASKALESRKNLLAQGAIARKQVDDQQVVWAQAKAQLDAAQEHLRVLSGAGKQEQIATAQAQVESAKAQFQSAEAQVAFTEIHTPIGGVVADRPVYTGDMASPGSPLFVIMDISRVVARINVPQAQASAVRVGQDAELAVLGSDDPAKGKVTVVSPATDANSTTVQVWIQVNNPGEKLKPGASVHGKIIAEEIKAATVVPAAAILPGEEGGTAVLVVGSDSIAHKRPVQLGVREGGKIQVLTGARPGESVVIVGGLGVDDKAKVRIVDTTVQESDDEDNPEPDAKPSPAKGGEKKDEAKPKGQ
ncbi:MAG TPA: efflux RND transporter periplasmic adaptor subunit [Bryobacteraceae bacterium]|nr:efflux RND transporter periplasmic adaptor subunit [Bryobacteraceae bacterium]